MNMIQNGLISNLSLSFSEGDCVCLSSLNTSDSFDCIHETGNGEHRVKIGLISRKRPYQSEFRKLRPDPVSQITYTVGA